MSSRTQAEQQAAREAVLQHDCRGTRQWLADAVAEEICEDYGLEPSTDGRALPPYRP